MIIKELDPFSSEDKFLKAGRAAEEKMAFYLRVDFEDDKAIHVLNSVRIELDDGAVQIDHLVIHPWGVTIVESKSITGKLQIKDDGQWLRWFGDKSSGMESPIVQATIQAKRLRKHLNLTAKPDGFFDGVPIDVLVAVSDQGIILHPKSGPIEGILKADQIVGKIQERMANYQQNRHPILKSSHLDKIAQYLAAVHKPLAASVVKKQIPQVELTIPPTSYRPTPIRPSALNDRPVCKHCSGSILEVQSGKYGYYFRCVDCCKNTAIQSKCPSCGKTEKIHKQGTHFTAECETCNASRHFYSNMPLVVNY